MNSKKEIWVKLGKVMRFSPDRKEIAYYIDFTGTGYQISNLGRLKGKKGNFLSNNRLINGYITNTLKDINNKPFVIKRHILVMCCFKQEEYSNFKYIRHLDHNKCNNNLNNLEWVEMKF